MDSAAGPMELVAALLRGVTPAELAGGVAAGERAEVRALLASPAAPPPSAAPNRRLRRPRPPPIGSGSAPLP